MWSAHVNMIALPWTRWVEYSRRWIAENAGNPFLAPLLDPILHPSTWRIQVFGLTLFMGHPIFFWIWSELYPQPYEVLWQRLLMSGLGICLLLPYINATPPTRGGLIAFTAIIWITLPVFFSWMYLANGRNHMWMATLSVSIVICYHICDWRITTMMLSTGVFTGWGLFKMFGPDIEPVITPVESMIHLIVIGFSWYMGLMLGLSSSNLQRELLKQVQGTMVVMAKEMRAHLALMQLIGDSLRREALSAHLNATLVDQLGGRLPGAIRNMSRQLDVQITNAHLLQMPRPTDVTIASDAVQEAAREFHYRNERERSCVSIIVHRDFQFLTSRSMFRQVIDNMIMNSLRSLASLPFDRNPGDITIEIDATQDRGYIIVSDRGAGMTEEIRSRVFEPFVSTHQGTGHGLGLAFSRLVVQNARGHIRVDSAPAEGARFTIDVPVIETTVVATQEAQSKSTSPDASSPLTQER